MSKIEWTNETWNPVTGCAPCATGCKNCYAREMHRRLRAMGQAKYQHDFSEVKCHPEELEKPSRWRKPRMVFVCSMSDLFHPDVPDLFIQYVCAAIDEAPHHTYQILTKRPERMAELVRAGVFGHQHNRNPKPYLWLGASASTQNELWEAFKQLEQIPAAVRFLSLEPLIESIDAAPFLPAIDWVIAGAESGPHRRFASADWFRLLSNQCAADGVPFFLKQMDGPDCRLHKMPELDGRVWDQMPEVRR